LLGTRLLRRSFFVLVAAVVALSIAAIGARPVRAAFPGINGKIAFQSNRDGNWEIYVMNADGSGQTRLTFNAAADTEPAWSPDGSKIAFVSTRDSAVGSSDIYVMNADGSGQTRLTFGGLVGGGLGGNPAWSPDGTRIAFDDTSNVYVMNANGSAVTNFFLMSPNPELRSMNYPAWSPDGQHIAFTGRVLNGLQDDGIFVMNAYDGSGKMNLTPPSSNPLAFHNHNPSWSADGSKISFDRFGADPLGGWEIYAINAADGTGQVNLTNNPFNDNVSAWSPDNSKITFESDRSGNADIWVMSADGSGPVDLTNNPAADEYPDWQPQPGPTSKAQCKKGGWRNFTNPSFKNQGQCVAYVNHHDGRGSDDEKTSGATAKGKGKKPK
jgi:Tol biopolymer transport system component